MKTIERAHMPNKLWERVKLPRNYMQALEIIDKHLMYWPKLLVHKIKQRLTKLIYMRIRMRKLASKTREKIMTTPRKEIKREARREKKAETAAVLEKSIENELLERLNRGVYPGDIVNAIPLVEYNKFLDKVSEDKEEEYEVEYVEGYEDLEEEDDIEDFGGLALKDNDASDDDEEEAVTVHERKDKKHKRGSRKHKRDEPSGDSKRKRKVLYEVEHDDADERQTAVL